MFLQAVTERELTASEEAQLDTLMGQIFHKDPDIVQKVSSLGMDFLTQPKVKFNLLARACSACNLQLIQFLMEKLGAPQLEWEWITVIELACMSGEVKVLELLSEHGGPILNVLSLHYAVYWGHVSVVKYLVEQGQNLNVLDNEGRTPLQYAERLGLTRPKHQNIALYLRGCSGPLKSLSLQETCFPFGSSAL